MKRLFIITTLCLICLAGFAQERVNRPKLSFISEGAVLNTFTGWAYDSGVGEWVDCKNVIEHSKQYSKYANSETWKSHTYNNIISLQFKTINCKGTNYYVLVWNKFDGAYKYPHIREEWSYWKIKLFLMFDEYNMDKLRNLTNDPIIIEVPTAKQRRYSDAADVDIIQTEMESSYQSKSNIVIYKATDGSIRFLFKDYIYRSIGTGIDKEYFEISEEDYLKLIDIHF